MTLSAGGPVSRLRTSKRSRCKSNDNGDLFLIFASLILLGVFFILATVLYRSMPTEEELKHERTMSCNQDGKDLGLKSVYSDDLGCLVITSSGKRIPIDSYRGQD